jgi:Asp-tRNA(Asn)/Glu-tRNA(Gln) amidotransferase A subunit family amidase
MNGGHSDLAGQTLTELSRLVAARRATSQEIVSACLARIAAREPLIKAWTHIDAEQALGQARACDAEAARSPLHGLPIAIKDIFDTADMPTEYGSPIYAGHRPRRDAAVVALLRRAGAVILGKTVTAEFAAAFPGPTINPRNPAHTPGGSSSGSAAAVADRMVPAALGTQTLGSIIRPASYCGIVGFKPSYGLVPVEGAKSGAQSLDTVGFLLRDIGDAALLLSALAPPADWSAPLPQAPRLALVRGPAWDQARPETVSAIDDAARRLAKSGARVSEVDPPPALGALHEAAWTILCFETAQNLTFERCQHETLLSPPLRKILALAEAISLGDYRAALLRMAEGRQALDRLLARHDAILTAAATGEAPHGLASTGDAVFNRAWTAAHVPCVTVPAGVGPNGLPVGIQLVGRQWGDASLIALARWAASRLDGLTASRPD